MKYSSPYHKLPTRFSRNHNSVIKNDIFLKFETVAENQMLTMRTYLLSIMEFYMGLIRIWILNSLILIKNVTSQW